MKLLSRYEEIILLAILKLKDNAYGVSIRKLASKETEYDWPYGAIYVALDILVKKKFVTKQTGEPTSERGGRRKVLYQITPKGKKVLREIRKIQGTVWAGISETAIE